MPEQQNIEYKSSWHDDYLKWICGFANAQGGRIYIGKNDAGKVIGVEDYKKLMDEIPNKIKNNLGIIAEVNLLKESNKHFIEIIVLPYSVPISLRGRYYYRSGSVKQELTGTALNEFLLKRSGHTWDDVIETRASFDDIDEKTVKIFLRKADEAGRGLVVRLFKDRFSGEELQKMGLNDRQIKAVLYVKEKGKITNREYQEINKISERTASREILELVRANIIEQSGTFGAGSFYQLITPE